jgi:hypothetical protein
MTITILVSVCRVASASSVNSKKGERLQSQGIAHAYGSEVYEFFGLLRKEVGG